MGALTNLIHMGGSIITRKVDRFLFDWMMAVSNFLDDFNQQPAGVANIADASGGQRTSGFGAINNLLESNISFPEWRPVNSTRKLTRIQSVNGLLDGVWVNPLKNTGGVGEFSHLVTPNPGATGGTFGVSMIMPSGVVNNTVQLLLLDTNGATVLFSTIVTVTQLVNEYTLTCTGMTPNKVYFVAVRVNNSGQQANPIIGRCRFTPNGGTGTFALNPDTGLPAFVRIGLNGNLATGTNLAGWNSNVYPLMNSATDFIFNTTAKTAAVEAFNNNGDGQFWMLYAGLPMAESAVIANQGILIQDFSLPTVQTATDDVDQAARPMSLIVRSGLATGPVSPGGGNGNYGAGGLLTAPRCVYLPLGASFSIQPNNAQGLLIYSGDSVGIGAGTVDAGFQGFAIGMRDVYPGPVICESYVSQALFNFVGPGNDPAKQKNYALYLSKNKATDHVIDLAVNDKVNALWPVAQFQTALQGVVTNLLSFNPQARIWLKTPCITTTEGANGLGDTMPNYRTAIAAVVTAINDSRVVLIDGTSANFAIAADLIDTVHFGPTGLAKNREAMLLILAGTSSLLGPAT